MDSLPAELLLEIFLHLGNIDDALHLGLCCRRSYFVLNRFRFKIMKSIIVSDHPYAQASKALTGIAFVQCSFLRRQVVSPDRRIQYIFTIFLDW
jgi:hypothetical protein